MACNLRVFNLPEKAVLAILLFGCFLGLYGAKDRLSPGYVMFAATAYLIILASAFSSLKESILIFNNLQINEGRKVRQMNLVS